MSKTKYRSNPPKQDGLGWPLSWFCPVLPAVNITSTAPRTTGKQNPWHIAPLRKNLFQSKGSHCDPRCEETLSGVSSSRPRISYPKSSRVALMAAVVREEKMLFCFGLVRKLFSQVKDRTVTSKLHPPLGLLFSPLLLLEIKSMSHQLRRELCNCVSQSPQTFSKCLSLLPFLTKSWG